MVRMLNSLTDVRSWIFRSSSPCLIRYAFSHFSIACWQWNPVWFSTPFCGAVFDSEQRLLEEGGAYSGFWLPKYYSLINIMRLKVSVPPPHVLPSLAASPALPSPPRSPLPSPAWPRPPPCLHLQRSLSLHPAYSCPASGCL